MCARLPQPDQTIAARVFLELWVPVRIYRVDSEGNIDAEDEEGCTWSFGLDQRGEAWCFSDEVPPASDYARALMDRAALAERERGLSILRAYSVRGAGWIDSPEAVIQAIESGVSMGAGVPSSETGGHRAS